MMLSIDPSGNFTEGKGRTGYVIFACGGLMRYGTINAKDYPTRVAYWQAVANLLEQETYNHVVIEDYRLYNIVGMNIATQSFSQMETPRLLGLLETRAQELKIPLTLQMAATTKSYSDDILIKRGKLERRKNRFYYQNCPMNNHERSALRHLFKYLEKQGVRI
jgi:hypothetical protein